MSEDDHEGSDRPFKRIKIAEAIPDDHDDHGSPKYQLSDLLPPSASLLRDKFGSSSHPPSGQTLEQDVGITEYISSSVVKIQGIIKQRLAVIFTHLSLL